MNPCAVSDSYVQGHKKSGWSRFLRYFEKGLKVKYWTAPDGTYPERFRKPSAKRKSNRAERRRSKSTNEVARTYKHRKSSPCRSGCQLIPCIFITTGIIIGLSSGFDSAMRSIIATKVPLLIAGLPSALFRTPFFRRNVRNKVAAILS